MFIILENDKESIINIEMIKWIEKIDSTVLRIRFINSEKIFEFQYNDSNILDENFIEIKRCMTGNINLKYFTFKVDYLLNIDYINQTIILDLSDDDQHRIRLSDSEEMDMLYTNLKKSLKRRGSLLNYK